MTKLLASLATVLALTAAGLAAAVTPGPVPDVIILANGDHIYGEVTDPEGAVTMSREYLEDPRITTELVDHLPASATVPTPLKFLGHMPGTPGELTRAADIHRYFAAIDKASDRVAMWTIGQTEEGRDMILVAIADEATIKSIDKYKQQIAQLTDPRRTSDEQAQQLLKTAKPIYYLTSGMHSLSAHVEIDDVAEGRRILRELQARLAKRFGLDHVTLQLECAEADESMV